MKAIVQTGPQSIEVQSRDIPEPMENEVLVKVLNAGLCGSDAHAYKLVDGFEWIQIPRVMGHEYSGEVAEVGDGVTEYSPGDLVIEEPIQQCGACFQCKNGERNVCQDTTITGMHNDGAYAEYTIVDEKFLHAIPDTIPGHLAATTEPLSVAVRSVYTRSDVTPGDSVLVEGPGPIGVFTAALVDSLGANVVMSGVGRDKQYRLPLVEELGIETVNIEDRSLQKYGDEFTDGLGFDAVFDTTGHHSGIESALDVVRKGGEIVEAGLPGEPSEVFLTSAVRSEVSIKATYGSTWEDFERAIRVIENGEIDIETIIDTGYDIDSPEEAFTDFLAAKTCKPVFSFA